MSGKYVQDVTLSTVDIIVLGITLAISSGIGIYYRFTGGRQKTLKEFLMADGEMSILPVACSLMASFMSAVTLLGVPKENYFHGAIFFLINISYIIGTPIAAYVFLPVFFRMKVVSAYEYLERRFDRKVRLFASAIFIIQMMLYMSVVVLAPAKTLHAITHLSKWTSILSVGVICTFYCTIGGMKAVLWTDVFQSVLMFGSMIAVVIVGTVRMGGLSEVFKEASHGGRLVLDNFSFNPEERHTIWSLIFGTTFMYLSIYAVNQAQVQRMMTVKSLKKAQIAMFIQWPVLTTLSFVCCLTGLVIYANYRDCDPYIRGKISDPDQILPYFVMDHLSKYDGLPGLFVAGIFCGALSTVSSAINALAAVTYEDFLKPANVFSRNPGILIKVLAFSYGVVCVFLAGLADRLGGLLPASFVFFGVGGGPLFGVFCLGMLHPRCSKKGAFYGLLAGILTGLWVGSGAMLNASAPQMLPLSVDKCPEEAVIREGTKFNSDSCSAFFPLCNISYQWYTFVAWLPTVLVGVLTSFVWPATNVPKVYLSPLLVGNSDLTESNNLPQDIDDFSMIEKSSKMNADEEKTHC